MTTSREYPAFFVIAFVTAVLFVIPALAQTTEDDDAHSTQIGTSGSLAPIIKAQFSQSIGNAQSALQKSRLREISGYYASSNHQLLWIADGQVTSRARSVLEIIRRAHEHALDPEEYFISPLLGRAVELQVQFDVSLSNALVAYAQHLHAGRVDPESVDRGNVIYPEAISPARILREATATTSIDAYLRLLAPRTPRYERLRLALQDYWAIADAGGWEQLPAGDRIEPGITDPRIPALRRRLSVSGDYVGTPDDVSTLYEGDIVEAVIAFQKRHGLEQDGVVDAETLRELNVTIEDRIAIMEVNLERRRWMQDDYGRHHVFVNLADRVLKVVKDNKTIHAEIITPGSGEFRIPVFTRQLERVEINPYWNVPDAIAVEELLARLQEDAAAVQQEGYEVVYGNQVLAPTEISWNEYSGENFPFKLRQRPDSANGTGRIKFVFSNSFGVFAHDLAESPLVASDPAYFGPGALKLNKPLGMAQVILAENGWDLTMIRTALAARETTVVDVATAIPVHVAYLTAWVNKDGSVHFRRDIYGRDENLFEALAQIRS